MYTDKAFLVLLLALKRSTWYSNRTEQIWEFHIWLDNIASIQLHLKFQNLFNIHVAMEIEWRAVRIEPKNEASQATTCGAQ